MYEICYDYVKLKYGENATRCYNSIVHVKTGNIYKDTAEDVETKYDTSKLVKGIMF